MADRARVPIIEIIILLVLALIVFYPAIGRLFPPMSSVQWAPRKRSTEANVKVWVNLHSGVYYCRDSPLYGKQGPGKVMAQPEAVQHGYSPARDKRCQ